MNNLLSDWRNAWSQQQRVAAVQHATCLKRAGAEVVLTEYPDALHAYDSTTFSRPIQLPQAQTTRNCALREGDDGQMLNAKTGAIYTLADPCVEHGPHIGFNQAAYQATVKAGARIPRGNVQAEQLKLRFIIY